MNKNLVLIILFTLFTLKPVSAATVQLQSGWNMFSIPVNTTVDADTIRSKCGTAARIWNYNPSTRNYVDTAQLVPGLGYWIKLSSVCSVSVDGSDISINDFPSFNAGWNQIGTASSSIDFSTVRSSTNCNILSGPWLYNSSINNYNSSNTLSPGVGYWLRVGSSCNLTSHPQACSDGTAYGSCSSVEADKPKWCNSTGYLIPNQCGASYHNCPCPSGQSCNETTGSCYTPTACDSACKLQNFASGTCRAGTSDQNLAINGDFHLGLQNWTGYDYQNYAFVDYNVYHNSGQSVRIQFDPSWNSNGEDRSVAAQIWGGGTYGGGVLPNNGFLIKAGQRVYERMWIKTGPDLGWGDPPNPNNPTPAGASGGMDLRDMNGSFFTGSMGARYTKVNGQIVDLGYAPSIPWNTDWTLVEYLFGPANPSVDLSGVVWIANTEMPNHNLAWFADIEVYVLDPGQSPPPITGYSSGTCQSGETSINQDGCPSGVCCCSGNTQPCTPATDIIKQVDYPSGSCLPSSAFKWSHSTCGSTSVCNQGSCNLVNATLTSYTLPSGKIARSDAISIPYTIKNIGSTPWCFLTQTAITKSDASSNYPTNFNSVAVGSSTSDSLSYPISCSDPLGTWSDSLYSTTDYYVSGGWDVWKSSTNSFNVVECLNDQECVNCRGSGYTCDSTTNSCKSTVQTSGKVKKMLIAYSPNSIQDIHNPAEFDAIVFGYPPQISIIQTLKSQYPNIKVFFYLDILGQVQDVLYPSYGSDIFNPSSIHYWGKYIVDTFNSYKSQASGINGIMLDDVEAKTGNAATYPATVAQLQAMLSYVKSQLNAEGCLLMGNDQGEYTSYMDLGFLESFAYPQSGFWTYRTPQVDINTLTSLTGQGYGVVAAPFVYPPDTPTWCQFLYCCYLMGVQDLTKSYFLWQEWQNWQNVPSPSYGWYPVMDTDVGTPLGPYKQVGNVLYRNFTKVNVQVDLNANTGTITPVTTTTCPSLTYPADKWQRVWYTHSTGACLGNGPNQTQTTFDDNWASGVVAYNQADDIEFHSSRTINFVTAGTYTFTLGSDDGARLWIDDVLQLDKWVDRAYTTDSVNVQLTAGNHKFRIDYYENGGNAEVSFSYSQTFTPGGWKVFQNSTSNYLQNKTGQVIKSSSDATAVINAAIANAVSGDTIYIDAGTYTMTGSVSSQGKSGITLTLASGARLLAPSYFNSAGIYLKGVTGWIIQGDPTVKYAAELYGDGYHHSRVSAQYGDGIGVEIEQCSNITVQNLYIHQWAFFGVESRSGSSNIKILNNHVEECLQNGICLGQSGTGDNPNSLAQGNLVEYASDVGITVFGSNCKVLNNVVNHIDLVGYGWSGGNSAQGNGGHWGIATEGDIATNALIQGNTISDCSMFGIAIGAANAVTISATIKSNTISNTPQDIATLKGNGNTISNNILSGTGIGIHLTTNNNVGSGNSYDGLPTHVLDQGVGNSVS